MQDPISCVNVLKTSVITINSVLINTAFSCIHLQELYVFYRYNTNAGQIVGITYMICWSLFNLVTYLAIYSIMTMNLKSHNRSPNIFFIFAILFIQYKYYTWFIHNSFYA